VIVYTAAVASEVTTFPIWTEVTGKFGNSVGLGGIPGAQALAISDTVGKDMMKMIF
jgi:hypothetical protein